MTKQEVMQKILLKAGKSMKFNAFKFNLAAFRVSDIIMEIRNHELEVIIEDQIDAQLAKEVSQEVKKLTKALQDKNNQSIVDGTGQILIDADSIEDKTLAELYQGKPLKQIESDLNETIS